MISHKIKSLFYCLILFSGFSLNASGQSELYGIWTAGCAVEKYNSSSMEVSALCPTENPDKNSVDIKSFDLTVNESTLKLGNKPAIPYTWDKGTWTITFSFEKIEYRFKMLLVNLDNIIALKDMSNGTILVLQKK